MTRVAWPARRVKGSLRCGKKVDGRYDCQGIIARIVRFRRPDGEMAAPIAVPHAGMAPDGPGSHHWRPSTQAQRQQVEGRAPLGHAYRRSLPAPPETPWTMNCPHCGCLAIVNATC